MEEEKCTQEGLVDALRSSSTSRRIAELRNLRETITADAVAGEHGRSLITLLFSTYPTYRDRASRLEVQNCLQALLATSTPSLDAFVKLLKNEAVKTGLAPSNVFVLIEWTSLALQISSTSSEVWHRNGPDLIAADAALLELCMSQTSKGRIKNSALVVTRRALRKLFKSSDGGEKAIEITVQRLAAPGSMGSKNAVLLGIIAGVCRRLIDPYPAGGLSPKEALEKLKSLYYTFWVREVINSKSSVPKHIGTAFHEFFSGYSTLTDLQKDIVPSLEKAMLRAPEVVLNDVVRQMVSSLPGDMDLSSVVLDRLLKPLLANVKSTNNNIRNGAITTLTALLKHCNEKTMISQEISTPLTTSKLTSIEQRTLYSRVLAALLSSERESIAICQGLAPIVAKEPNEMALAAEVNALTSHLGYLLSLGCDQIDAAIGAFQKGLGDKRPSVQRIWALEFGNLIWQMNERTLDSVQASLVVEAVLPRVLDLFNEVASNPLPAVQSGTIVLAFVLTSLFDRLQNAIQKDFIKTLLQKSKVFTQALTFEPKPSFLLNNRVYCKISNEEDLRWLTRSLAACADRVCASGTAAFTSDAWVQAFIYVITATQVPFAVQNQAAQSFKEAYRFQPQIIGKLTINGLWNWYLSIASSQKDPAAVSAPTNLRRAHVIIRSICSHQEDIKLDVLQDQLIDMLVLCRPEIIPKANWIEFCIATGQDPGSIASINAQRCVDRVNSLLERYGRQGPASETINRAGRATFAELAFVAPAAITPLLVKQIQTDLDSTELRKFGPTDFAIARTPEGTAFIDVLSHKTQNEQLDKGASDYDTRKWEAEVRAQIAAKKGQQKKLTADEQAKVKAQLAKEASTRAQVLELDARLQRGLGIVHGLATGPPTETDIWLAPALQAVLSIIEAGVGKLVGDKADQSYVACSTFVSLRLGNLRPFIGVATLRAFGSTHLPNDLMEEPLGALVTRLLYRLRLAGEQRPFDSASLNYMIPLLLIVLQRHGIGQTKVDDADEQLALALEILSYHTDVFANQSLPRSEVIATLTRSMQKFTQHYKLIKDCLNDICRAIAPTASTSEIAELLRGALAPQPSVRTAVLQAVQIHIDLTVLDFSAEIWIECHDDVEENAQFANEIWQENALEVEGKDAFHLIPYLERQDRPLRRATSRAISACVAADKKIFTDVLNHLKDKYREKNKPRVPERDAYGILKRSDLSDPWEARSGIALAFKELASTWNVEQLVPFVEFLIIDGPLGDGNASVRDDMIDSATAIISSHGGEKLEELMKMLENSLEASEKGSNLSDLVNEAVVILYGALARHLKAGDERVPAVVRRLLQTLSTPSETVQYAVAGCLPPLIQTSSASTPQYIQEVLDQLLQSKKYSTRRGAAYGLAGIVRGKGISALREYRIMSSLRGAIENKKEQNQRQGALLAYELLSLILGRNFEPYVIQIVPHLLASFGDASADVREACLDAAKTCFASLSSYGVKIILPTLLEGLEESQWRSKKGACDLLGAMAYLDPQQLALSLPDIIPPLTNVLNDSHKEVRAAANRSLQRFGEVISNPEVKGLVGVLLKALSDPTKYTDDALDSLIKVSFVHYLDAPSLALVVRILERGLGDRSGTKRKSAQIIGSLAHLSERKDLISHLPILVAGLKLGVVDPVPTTRATSSKALGSLVEKLGEDALPDLIPSLMATLKSDTGAGDRLGSAQALSEVLAALGTGRLEETLPTILQNVSSNRPSVREGFMSLFIYLPACFGNSFATYLSKIIPPILAGLADEVESIRETALRAGRLLVKNFATKAIDLLLPELDRGLADDSYRIRLSSVELVGDLLFNLTGISGKADQDEEDTGAAEAGQSLLEVLGEEKRNKILSSLYICRCDTSGLVRSAAINVWKALVATPRTLKELIPTLTQLIIRRLASSNMEQKVIAGNALGELIRKAGEGVLSTLLPTLEEGLQTSTDIDNKQGICIALREIISSASPDTLEDYEKTLISVVRSALVDSDDEVRETAAEAFDSLQQIFGKRAVDQVLPYLLNLLRTEGEADTALAALLTLLTDNTRSSIILPNLIPTLLTSPITAFNARAIASLAEVAGPAMSRRLPTILNSIMDNIIACKSEDLRGDLESSFDAVLLSVDEFDGLNTAMGVMIGLSKHDDHRRRANADIRLSKFFEKSEIDYSRYNQDLIRVLLLAFDDRDSDVVKAAWAALSELVRHLRKEEMESLVAPTRQILQQVGVPGSCLPGFSLPKGINAILPIFLQGLMNGTAEQRTQSALAISDIIDRTSSDALKPFVTNITGPLIRVVSERSVELKSAILLTLNNLLEKIPLFLKPFLPQLQRTFAKSLADTTSDVLRNRAAKALGTLLTLKPRVDPLIAELITGAKSPDPGVRNAMLKALFEVVSKAGENMSEVSRSSILSLIDSEPSEADDSTAITNARLLGALVKVLPAADANTLIKHRVLVSRCTPASVLSLNAVLLESPTSLIDSFAQETPAIICQTILGKQTYIADNGVLAAGKYLLHGAHSLPYETAKPVFEALATAITPGNPVDMRRLALVVVRTVSRQHNDVVRPHLPLLAPPIFASVRDMVIPVKLAAEAAFLALFSVAESENAVFDKYIAGAGAGLNPTAKKSMQDYFKRVALRLGAQARERSEAEGGQGGLGLSNDEEEDEREILSVGKVDLGDAFANE